MRLGEKTLKLLREQNKKQSDLADAIGAGTSTVAGWKYENRNPSSDMIVPICKFLGISPNELLEYESLPILGNNDRAINSCVCADDDERFLISTFRDLDPPGKRYLLGSAETERRRVLSEGIDHAITVTPSVQEPAPRHVSYTKKRPSTRNGRKAVLGDAAAGVPIEAVPDTDGSTVSVPSKYLSDEYIIVKARGDSMIDAGIESGDFCVFQVNGPRDSGKIMLIQLEGNTDVPEGTIKRVFYNGKTVELRSANPAYPPMQYPIDSVHLVGVLVAVYSPER